MQGIAILERSFLFQVRQFNGSTKQDERSGKHQILPNGYSRWLCCVWCALENYRKGRPVEAHGGADLGRQDSDWEEKISARSLELQNVVPREATGT